MGRARSGASLATASAKKDLGTLLPNKNDTSNTKNTIYVFKDKSTTTVCYDGKNVNYITVHMNS